MMKTPQHLHMGPWTHGGWGSSFSGDVDFGPDAVLDDYAGYRMRWFDRWLKGIDNGVDAEKPVRIFVMGGGNSEKDRNGRLSHMGEWRDVEDWPLAETDYTPYYIHGDGSLSREEPQVSVPTPYTFDPRDPVQGRSTRGATSAFTAAKIRFLCPPEVTFWFFRLRF